MHLLKLSLLQSKFPSLGVNKYMFYYYIRVDCFYKNICINVCTIKTHAPRAHEVKHQRVIAKRTSQIMKYGQDVIIQKRTDDNIQ